MNEGTNASSSAAAELGGGRGSAAFCELKRRNLRVVMHLLLHVPTVKGKGCGLLAVAASGLCGQRELPTQEENWGAEDRQRASLLDVREGISMFSRGECNRASLLRVILACRLDFLEIFRELILLIRVPLTIFEKFWCISCLPQALAL